VANGGSYYTWLHDNGLPIEGRKFKPFLPSGLPAQLKELRTAMFECPRFRSMIASERQRLERKGEKHGEAIETSLWSRIVQTCEDEVLSIIDRALFDLGWDVWALIFDGLMAAPSAECKEPDIKKALEAAEKACNPRWQIKLADKDLHGLQGNPVKTIVAAREALEAFDAFKGGMDFS